MISVILPTYNRADLVGRAIASVVGQTHQNIELIVVDDGSTDNTESIVAGWAERADVTVRYFKQANAGCASARNAGLREAAGGYFAFLDSDDEWAPNAAESLLAVLEESGADFVYSPAVEVFADGREFVNFPVAAGRPEGFAPAHFHDTNVRNGAVLFRRNVLASVGDIDESLRHNEDSDFLQRVSIACRAAYSTTPTVRWHQHAGNKSSNRVEICRALIRSSSKVLESYPDFAAELGDGAAERMHELNGLLIESLLLAGEMAEARRIAAEVAPPLSLSVRAALASGTAIPIRLKKKLALVWRRFIATEDGGNPMGRSLDGPSGTG